MRSGSGSKRTYLCRPKELLIVPEDPALPADSHWTFGDSFGTSKERLDEVRGGPGELVVGMREALGVELDGHNGMFS